ncbi:MAG: VOC family protein [Actinomycetota bacterium]|nr:VOC family protein [Actinomycetota bacterium]
MKKLFKTVEHIGIYSSDTTRLANWYIELFGLELLLKIEKRPESKSVYFLKSNGTVIEVLPAKSDAGMEREIGDTGINHIGVIVENFDEAEKYFEKRGVVLSDIRETSLGWKIGYLRDLEDNIIEVIHKPENHF